MAQSWKNATEINRKADGRIRKNLDLRRSTEVGMKIFKELADLETKRELNWFRWSGSSRIENKVHTQLVITTL